jgi:protein Shroom
LFRSKRDKLADQLDEAKKLKANIDKRSSTVLSILRKYLSDHILSDYNKFIKMKARLVMETRQVNDKITLGEEQRTILKETKL